MTQEALKLALEKIATVNAMDYEYQAWAREALAQTQEPVQFKCTVIDDVHPNGIPLEQWAKPPQRTWVGSGDLEDSNAYLTPLQRTEQLKACVYCGQLVVKEKNT